VNLELYRSSLDGPALGICIFAGYLLYRTYKHYSAILITLGFIIVVYAFITNGFCMGVSEISDYIKDYPYLCHPATAHIRGIGYILIATGLLKFIEYIKSA